MSKLSLPNHLFMFIMCQDFICIISWFSQWLYEVTTITVLFTDEDRKAQGGWMTYLRSSSKEEAELRFKPKTSWLQACTFKHHSHFFCKLIFRQVKNSAKWEVTYISQASNGYYCVWGLCHQTFFITLYSNYYYYHPPPPRGWSSEKLSNMPKVTNLGSGKARL